MINQNNIYKNNMNESIPNYKHKDLQLPLCVINVDDYNKAKDKVFLNDILDDVYDTIFKKLTVYDLFLWKTSTKEHISFFYEETPKANKFINLIATQLKLLEETENHVTVTITVVK